ncbi:MAG: hypothetical protein R2828_01315 [Saprospiraceae bacterium]
MLFNKKVDVKTNPIADIDYFEDSLIGWEDHLYITFVAIEGDHLIDAWSDKEDSFLRIALPYEEVLKGNARNLMKDYLLRHLDKLSWLDYEAMKIQISEKLAA